MSTAIPPEMELQLRTALTARGQRYTEQRAAVYGFLVSTASHPTAEDVFLQVRSEVPGISLATVYKSLETLVACGLARKLAAGGGSARYDGDVSNHHHARCLACGAIVDVAGPSLLTAAHGAIQPPAGFHLVEARVELSGYCQACTGPQSRDANA